MNLSNRQQQMLRLINIRPGIRFEGEHEHHNETAQQLSGMGLIVWDDPVPEIETSGWYITRKGGRAEDTRRATACSPAKLKTQ